MTKILNVQLQLINMLKNERMDEEVNLMNMKLKALFGIALMYAPVLAVALAVVASAGHGGWGGWGGW